MILDPDTYQCSTHDIDLTTQVREQMEEDHAPVAYRWGARVPRNSPAREFGVIVSCPGADSPHQLTCRGKLTP